jgi:hypothetical protein
MTLWPGISSVTACWGAPFAVTGAAGASDMVRRTILDALDEQIFEPVFVDQLDGLRREGGKAVRTLNSGRRDARRQSNNHHGGLMACRPIIPIFSSQTFLLQSCRYGFASVLRQHGWQA